MEKFGFRINCGRRDEMPGPDGPDCMQALAGDYRARSLTVPRYVVVSPGTTIASITSGW